MRIVVFSTLFPNSCDPTHGSFVLERLRHLTARHRVEAVVVAPVPWFPNVRGFGRWSRMGAVPREETIEGLQVFHPRYLVVPKVGMSLVPLTLALGCRRLLARLKKRGFDVLDAHYLYPDGVAAALLAGQLRSPFVVTGRGSDVYLLPKYRLARLWIGWALRKAQARAAVSRSLAERMSALAGGRLDVAFLRNGVDLELFRPIDRLEARRTLGLPEGSRLVASVGHLIERKGHHHAIGALARLHRSGSRDVSLVIVGDGPWKAKLQRLARAEGIEGSVVFLGKLAHREVAPLFAAVDLLLLASHTEGWANVLLEALACGTPVVATDLPGTREVMASGEVGILVSEPGPEACAAALGEALAREWNASAIRAYAEGFSWNGTSDGQMAMFGEALRRFADREATGSRS